MSSIKDVAREAGVSTATVSHVINKTRFVSEEVRERVERAIERFQYHPNAHARSLASGKSRIIGLVISDISNPFFPELVKAIETAAFERGYDVILSNTNYETERASHYVRRFIERKVAGVAVMTSEMDQALVEMLVRRDVPAVFLDSGETGRDISNLRVDYASGIRQSIEHLVALGHRDIAFIGGTAHFRSARRRREAFRAAMREHFPQSSERIFEGNFKIEGGRRAASQILREKDLPTAVVCANDLMAIGAMHEFHAAGLKVPREISIVGFDDIAFAGLSQPSLTTVNLPRGELGRRAVEALLETLDDPKHQGFEIRVPTNLIVRESTAPARV
jgi:DNA-binding LacI/PurR family transcriptional regulator